MNGGAEMKLCIDGMCITPKPGQSILDLIRMLDLDNTQLSKRPLAAQIAG